tara:strand:+ start:386 stop:676 length:291 start_codon:yes stop_codon:yes gene_type:complete
MTEYYEHPQYRFECINADGDRTEMEFSAEKLPQVSAKFVDFLRAVGFSYVTGISVLSKGNDRNPTNWNYHFDEWGEYEHPPMDDLINQLEEKVADE